LNKQINPNRSEGLDGDEWERLLADVRGHIWEYRDLSKLAKDANLSIATISNLAYGVTTSPHMRTIIRVMVALDKSDPILEAFKSEKPVSVKQAKARKSARARLKDQRKTKVHPHRAEKPARASAARLGGTVH
jgi:hypothetical protein